MITNCSTTIVRDGHAVYVKRAEWQSDISLVKESGGVKHQYSTTVFVYGKEDRGIKPGDYILKGTRTEVGSLSGAELLKFVKLNGGKVIQSISDNREESLPHIEIRCSV